MNDSLENIRDRLRNTDETVTGTDLTTGFSNGSIEFEFLESEDFPEQDIHEHDVVLGFTNSEGGAYEETRFIGIAEASDVEQFQGGVAEFETENIGNGLIMFSASATRHEDERILLRNVKNLGLKYYEGSCRIRSSIGDKTEKNEEKKITYTDESGRVPREQEACPIIGLTSFETRLTPSIPQGTQLGLPILFVGAVVSVALSIWVNR